VLFETDISLLKYPLMLAIKSKQETLLIYFTDIKRKDLSKI